jgi:hypothetical protein
MSRRDHAPGEQRSEELDRDDRPLQPEPSERMRALQRRAGNHALSARLARAPDAGKPDVKEAESDEGSGATATLPDIGTIPVTSVRFPGRGGPSGGRSAEVKEMVLTSRAGKHSPKLAEASAKGTLMDVEVILRGGKLRMKLMGAIVSRYEAHSPGENTTEVWGLSFASFEQSTEDGS